MEHRGKVRFSTLLSETELWAREDWQKVSSSLSHDAFIRRPSLPLASRGQLSLSLSSLLRWFPQHLQSSLTLTVYFVLEGGGQWERPPSPRCPIIESCETASFFSFLSLRSARFPPRDRYIHMYRAACTYRVFIFVFTSRKRRKRPRREWKGEGGPWIGRGPERILRRRSLRVAAATSWNTRDR